MTEDDIGQTPGSNDKKVIALELVLLFHSASPWDWKKSLKWTNRLAMLLPCKDEGWADATTKHLCDAVRVALLK
jgi:hypothetical protein